MRWWLKEMETESKKNRSGLFVKSLAISQSDL